MDLVVLVEAQGPGADLYSLRDWLVAEPMLRGQVRLIQPAPASGTLGSAIEALAVGIGQGGAATALASVLIAWIRRRVGDVTVKLTRPDGNSTEVTAKHVPGLDAAGIAGLVADIAKSLEVQQHEDNSGDKC
jgi:hypothetical protein